MSELLSEWVNKGMSERVREVTTKKSRTPSEEKERKDERAQS